MELPVRRAKLHHRFGRPVVVKDPVQQRLLPAQRPAPPAQAAVVPGLVDDLIDGPAPRQARQYLAQRVRPRQRHAAEEAVAHEVSLLLTLRVAAAGLDIPLELAHQHLDAEQDTANKRVVILHLAVDAPARRALKRLQPLLKVVAGIVRAAGGADLLFEAVAFPSVRTVLAAHRRGVLRHTLSLYPPLARRGQR